MRAQPVACGPDSRAEALGGGCGCSPSCLRIFSITGRFKDGRDDLEIPGAAVQAVLHVDVTDALEQAGPAVEEGVEFVLDEPGQLGAGAGFGVGDEGGQRSNSARCLRSFSAASIASSARARPKARQPASV